MNRQTFSIYLRNRSDANRVYPTNLRKTFSISINKKTVFTSIIYGFTLVGKYILNITSNVNIVATIRDRSRFSYPIKIGRYNFTLNSIRENLEFVASSSYKISTLFFSRELLSITVGIVSKIGVALSLKQGLPNSLSSVSSLIVVFAPELRSYFTLGYHASSTLGAMSTQTLAELSYEIL